MAQFSLPNNSKKTDSNIAQYECIRTIRQLQKQNKIASNIKQAINSEAEE